MKVKQSMRRFLSIGKRKRSSRCEKRGSFAYGDSLLWFLRGTGATEIENKEGFTAGIFPSLCPGMVGQQETLRPSRSLCALPRPTPFPDRAHDDVFRTRPRRAICLFGFLPAVAG